MSIISFFPIKNTRNFPLLYPYELYNIYNQINALDIEYNYSEKYKLFVKNFHDVNLLLVKNGIQT